MADHDTRGDLPLDELADDQDELDGCDIDLAKDPTFDDEIADVVRGRD